MNAIDPAITKATSKGSLLYLLDLFNDKKSLTKLYIENRTDQLDLKESAGSVLMSCHLANRLRGKL